MTTGRVHFQRETGDARIGRITLSHPGRLNVLSLAMWRELRAVARSLDTLRAPALRAVIVCGEGGQFAAGADVAEFPALRFDTAALRHYHEGTVAPALRALQDSDVPLLAQLQGACVGGGLEIAACCDLRIAAADARVGAPIARLGFPMAPDELAVLVAAFGRAQVAELLLEARLFDASEALRRGLVHRVVGDAAAEAAAAAARIAALPATVARANKRSLRALACGGCTEAERAAHFGYAAGATHREGVGAFLAGRASDFRDDDGDLTMPPPALP